MTQVALYRVDVRDGEGGNATVRTDGDAPNAESLTLRDGVVWIVPLDPELDTRLIPLEFCVTLYPVAPEPLPTGPDPTLRPPRDPGKPQTSGSLWPWRRRRR